MISNTVPPSGPAPSEVQTGSTAPVSPMQTPVLREPTLYCGPEVLGFDMSELSKEIELPFGLPTRNLPEDCDDLIKELQGLLSQLSFMSPIIQVIGCILKITDVLKAVPKVVVAPADFVEAMKGLVDCVILFGELSMIVPVGFCKMFKTIRGSLDGILRALNCIYGSMYVLLQAQKEAARLSESGDESLREMGKCLERENLRGAKNLGDSLKAIEGLIVLLNVLLAIVGPIVGQDIQIPLGGATKVSEEGLAAIETTITALLGIRKVLGAIPGC